MGSGLNAAEAVRRFPGPPFEDPPTSPPRPGTGASWGERDGTTRAQAATRRAARRKREAARKDMSSGASAAGVTPRTATGTAVEPLRSPSPAARPRAWRCTGWRSGRLGAQRSRSVPASSPSRPFARSGSGQACESRAREGRQGHTAQRCRPAPAHLREGPEGCQAISARPRLAMPACHRRPANGTSGRACASRAVAVACLCASTSLPMPCLHEAVVVGQRLPRKWPQFQWVRETRARSSTAHAPHQPCRSHRLLDMNVNRP